MSGKFQFSLFSTQPKSGDVEDRAYSGKLGASRSIHSLIIRPVDMPSLPTSNAIRHRKSWREYFKEEVATEWSDSVLLLGCLATGILDSAVFNAWSCFVSMQTGTPRDLLLRLLSDSDRRQHRVRRSRHDGSAIQPTYTVDQIRDIHIGLYPRLATLFPVDVVNRPAQTDRALTSHIATGCSHPRRGTRRDIPPAHRRSITLLVLSSPSPDVTCTTSWRSMRLIPRAGVQRGPHGCSYLVLL